MKKIFGIGIVVLGLMMVGCNAKPSLVGKWKGKIEQQGQQLDAVVEFKPDGKMISDVTTSGIQLQMLGKYAIKAETYEATIEDVKIIELPKEMEMARPLLEKGIKEQKGKSETTTFKFKDADTVEMSAPKGGTSVWTRMK
ncbi:MAG: hypothetical protein ACKVQS_00875 [Fimbriimonadaceae bacterium]